MPPVPEHFCGTLVKLACKQAPLNSTVKFRSCRRISASLAKVISLDLCSEVHITAIILLFCFDVMASFGFQFLQLLLTSSSLNGMPMAAPAGLTCLKDAAACGFVLLQDACKLKNISGEVAGKPVA